MLLVMDQALQWLQPVTFGSDWQTVRYSVAYQASTKGPAGEYTAQFIDEVMGRAAASLFAFMKVEGLPMRRCLRDRLEIYVVSGDTLNDHKRFRDWGPGNGVTDKNTFTVWALFDPMPKELGRTSIFLTEKGLWADEILLAGASRAS